MMNSNYLAEPVSLQKNILRFFVLAAMILSFPAFVFAQEAVELEKFLDEKSDNSEIVKAFVFGNMPAVSWKKGLAAADAPQSAQKLITDVASLTNVQVEGAQNRSVKFLQVNLENAAEKGQVRLNPNVLGSFVNLQYVFIQSQVNLTPAEVSAMVTGYEDGDIVLLFQVVSNF